MNNLFGTLLNMSLGLVEDVKNGIIKDEDIFERFTNMSYLDYCKMLNPRMYETFGYDNNENIEMLRKKLDRRDDIDQKRILIQAEKDKIIKYLESDEISEELAIFNKPIPDFFEFMKIKYEQAQNDPEMRDIFDDEDGQKLKSRAEIFIESADKFLNVGAFEEIELPVFFTENPQLRDLTSPDKILLELDKHNINDLTKFIPLNFSKLEGVELIQIPEIMDNSFKILQIHSQEQYYELLRIEERKLIGEAESSEHVSRESTKKEILKIPITIERGNTDTYTKLTVSQTAILFDYLSEAEATFSETKHNEYLKKINKAKAIQVLTGYRFGSITDSMEANTQKKKATDIREVRKIIEKIKELIIRDLA